MTADEAVRQLLDDAPHGRIRLEDIAICVDEHLALHALDVGNVFDGHDMYFSVELDD